MDEPRTKFDEYLAVPMFLASVLFLVCLAGAVHLHVGREYRAVSTSCHWGLVILSPLFVLELFAHLAAKSKCWKQNLLFCFVPLLRLGARDHVSGETIWLPWTGWSKVDFELCCKAEKAFNIPMIVIALSVLPLLTAEYFWMDQIESNSTFTFLTQAGSGLIWLAFTIEFVVMISIVDKKLRYCKEHWIDIVVIILPLLAFLRVARLGRLGRLLRMQQLTKTTRMYRLRGLLMRAYRGILVLEVINRLLRAKPEIQLQQLEASLAEKHREVEQLRREIQELQVALACDSPPSQKAA